jgi:hypothetical protein
MGKHMRNSEIAQSEVIGYSLLLGILVVGVGIIIVLAAPIIQESKNEAYLKNVEQGFTVLDSKVSMVGLGNSPSQLVQIYTQAGDIVINDDTYSHITVTFINDSSNESSQYVVYNSSMGTVEYTLGQDTIAYEGGGTFRKYPDDNAIMVTPPEFHYNGETLTLPIIRINSNRSIGGSGVINLCLISNNTPNVLYPNISINPEFRNPLLIGKTVYMTIRSDYYMAWAKYIRERTNAEVTTNSDTNEVRVQLNTKPNNQMQDLETPIDVFGFNVLNESALQNFSVILANGTSDMKMRLTTSETSTEPYFTIYAQRMGGLGPLGVVIELNYYEDNRRETWIWEVEALKDAQDNFYVDFLNNNGTIQFTAPPSSWTWVNESNCSGTYTTNDYFECGGRKLVQHYMSLIGPTISFYPDGHPHFDGFNPDNSGYVLYYDVMPPIITYLHVVEYKIQATVA